MFNKIFIVRQGRLGLTASCLGIKIQKRHSVGGMAAKRSLDTIELYRGSNTHCVNSFPGYHKLFDKG